MMFSSVMFLVMTKTANLLKLLSDAPQNKQAKYYEGSKITMTLSLESTGMLLNITLKKY